MTRLHGGRAQDRTGSSRRKLRAFPVRWRSQGQTGFGLVETLAGLVVFVLLAMMGTKAYRGVVANHKESDQVKRLTDAVAQTAELLSGYTMKVLAGPGSRYLEWSEPVKIGDGPQHFRYRIVPSPSVGGKADTGLVGLEVEAGNLEGGALHAERTFATLIPPNAGKGPAGNPGTQAEREAEADFYRGLKARIAALTEDVVDDNQTRLNTFSCYDKGQCCGFMREFFANPTIVPQDGLREKCMYRCALAGDVPMDEWRRACGVDFCGVAPWRTKQDCCRAIDAGECPNGSVCARVCLECVGEDGSTCKPPVCDGGWFNDIFDCANNQLCNGDPIPEGDIAGWGNVREICKVPACQGLGSDCGISQWVCCKDYWEPLARGQTPDPRLGLCAQISSQQACCEAQNRRGHFDISCTAGGEADGVQYNGTWYCADKVFTGGVDQYCAIYGACRQPTSYVKPPGPDCPEWNRLMVHDPWHNPDPPPPRPRPARPPEPPRPAVDPPKEEEKESPSLKDILDAIRKASKRDGHGYDNNGGRE